MRLGSRIFICYFVITLLCFSYPLYWVLDNMRTRYLEGIEDPLVDQANILAAIAGRGLQDTSFDPENWYGVFEAVAARRLKAQIYNLEKKSVDTRVYMTDTTGKIIFDSLDRGNIGEDYSSWRDVALTLQGRYGARSTDLTANDPRTSVLYVAAPIRVNGNLAGVLTVAKPTTNINTFLQDIKPRVVKVGLFAALAAIVLSYIAAGWIAAPIKRLTRYADTIRRGKRMRFPKLDSSEIGKMGKAFEKMQKALEGKQYVEQYVQNLTHEIKSPLSAIRGAAELLEEPMPSERRVRFLSNIRSEADRIQQIVDRMLELAALENLQCLKKIENVSFNNLVQAVLESKRPLLARKHLGASFKAPEERMVRGDSFLLQQAIANLIQNAIDFSPPYGNIELTLRHREDKLHFSVADNGPGIPDYAHKKIFEKFFSLQRPDSGKKSTGLGLNFVREVVGLHDGTIRLENQAEGGVRATLTLSSGRPMSA
jgi:two-component system sensor histidine kinase CreC